MKMIALHNPAGDKVWINPDNIVRIRDSAGDSVPKAKAVIDLASGQMQAVIEMPLMVLREMGLNDDGS